MSRRDLDWDTGHRELAEGLLEEEPQLSLSL